MSADGGQAAGFGDPALQNSAFPDRRYNNSIPSISRNLGCSLHVLRLTCVRSIALLTQPKMKYLDYFRPAFALALCGGCLTGFALSGQAAVAGQNTLTAQEKADGWRLLWDGKTFEGWRRVGVDQFPEKGWTIHEGVLTVHENGGKEVGAGGDIITRQRYANFDLLVDFQITPGANSGIKIFMQTNIPPVDPTTGRPTGQGSAIGLEFQILDDARHPDAKLGHDGNRTIGSLYDVLPPAQDKKVRPIGEWNQARILSQGQHVTFWLNGVKTVEFDRGSPAFRTAVAESKFKYITGFGEWADGHILLQDHGNEVSFRNVKIRELPGK